VPGDKFRPLKINRPTLRQIKSRLKIVGRQITAFESHLKEGAETPTFLKSLKSYCDSLKGYVANIGKEMQEAPPKSNNVRIGPRKYNLATA